MKKLILALAFVTPFAHSATIKTKVDDFDSSKSAVEMTGISGSSSSFNAKGHLKFVGFKDVKDDVMVCFNLNDIENLEYMDFNVDGTIFRTHTVSGYSQTYIDGNYSSNCWYITKEQFAAVGKAKSLKLKIDHINSYSVWNMSPTKMDTVKFFSSVEALK